MIFIFRKVKDKWFQNRVFRVSAVRESLAQTRSLKHSDLTLVWTCGPGNYGWWIPKNLEIQNNYDRDLRTDRSVSAREFQIFVSPGPVQGLRNFACPGSVRSLKIGPGSIRSEIQIFAGPGPVRP